MSANRTHKKEISIRMKAAIRKLRRSASARWLKAFIISVVLHILPPSAAVLTIVQTLFPLI